MPSFPSQLRLTGGDYFIYSLDQGMRRLGMFGSNCRIVLRLAGKPDTGRLQQSLAASPIFDWLGRTRLTRSWPIFAPRWRTGAPPAALFQEHMCNGGCRDSVAGLPPAILERSLRASRSPALALDLVCHADGAADLALSWNHALLDVHGAELLLRHLHDGGGATPATRLPEPHNPEQAELRLWQLRRGYRRRMLFARNSLGLINSVCREPLFSLLPGGTPGAPAGEDACATRGARRNHYRILTLTEAEGGRVEDHCQRLNAGFRRSLFHVAATVQAMHALAARRGNDTGAYLIPVPHNLRRPGAIGPILSNQLSFLFYRIEPGHAGSMSATLAELTRQMADQVRNQHPASFLAAMEMFKIMPPGFYLHRLGRPTGGKFATFFFSDSGETCAGMNEIFGAPIAAVTHLAPAPRPPGLTVIFSRFRQRHSATIAWVDDCLSAVEAEDLAQHLRSALLGEGAP